MTPCRTLGRMALDPTVALFSTIAVPFAARYAVAWSIEFRLQGIFYGASLNPRRLRSDYPPPNNPVHALLAFLIVSAGAWPIATLVAMLFRPAPAFATAAFIVSATLSLGYTLLRIRADDRRMREKLSIRLASRTS